MNKKKKKAADSFIHELAAFLEIAFISLFVTTLIFTYFFRLATVDGVSMENTLHTGERLITYKFEYEPECGDIVVISCNSSVRLDDNGQPVIGKGMKKVIVKRVIATGGQTLDIDFERGAVYVDGKMIDEPYITGLTHMDGGAFTGQYPITIPEGYIFVMGDNRAVSKDSRYEEVGLIPVEDVIGKAVMRIAPLKKIGLVS